MSCWPCPGLATGEAFVRMKRSVELTDACQLFWKMVQPSPLLVLARSLTEDNATGWLMRCGVHRTVFSACQPGCPTTIRAEAGSIVRIPHYYATPLLNTGAAEWLEGDDFSNALGPQWSDQLSKLPP